MGKVATSPSNLINEPTANLLQFKLDDLMPYTPEKVFDSQASKDMHLFFVGNDDVHEILKHILSRVTTSLYMNMFGYDDDELNDIIMAHVLDPRITVLITLDKSQSGGVHEKKLLDLDQSTPGGLAAFGSHFVIGNSATSQISHTKGFVADNKVAAEGSTNWSASGEGTFVVKGAPGGKGYKAQNNTQAIIIDHDTIARFQAELIKEHMAASKIPAVVKKPSTKLST